MLIRYELLNFVHLRQQFLVSKSHSRLAQARTVLITCVPDELANEMDVQRFASFVPGGVDKIWFFRDTKVRSARDVREAKFNASHISGFEQAIRGAS
jgi:hypothetical protein